MTDVTAHKKRKEERPSIPLPNGDTLDPRGKFAESVGLAEKTIWRMDLPTVYVGACAYVPRRASLELIASRVKQRREPPRRRRNKR